ncbi:MAG: beta strand repeat-containing protein [Gemmatimonas sp.]
MTNIQGTSGNDTIIGTARNDEIKGGGGDDLLLGGAGNDELSGGAGNDTLDGGSGRDELSGGSGNDVLVYGAAENVGTRDKYDGGDGVDTLRLVLTHAEWARADVQADIADFLHLAETTTRHGEANGHEFTFASLGLKVEHVENLQVVVDGVIVDPLHPVQAQDDAVAVDEDSTVVGNLVGNDSVINGVQSVEVLTSPSAGNLVVNADGSYSYTPGAALQHLAAGETATETFTYRVTDTQGHADTATATITINGVNDAPTAAADAATGSQNQLLTVDVVANDTDADDGHVLTLTGASVADGQGSVAVVDGQLAFDPGSDFDHLAPGATQDVVVTYTVSDELGATSTATATITVTGTNDAPVAAADSATTGENQPVMIDVLANDTDADDGHVLTLTGASVADGQGSVAVVDGQLAFNPGSDFDHLAPGATQNVVVTYTVSDEFGATSTATATITVTGTNDAPVVVADSATTGENQPVMIDVLANDTDADDGHVLTLTNVSIADGQGSVAVVDGQLAFNPGSDFDHLAPGATQDVVVTYTVSDEFGATSTATATITVTGTDDAPVATADSFTTTEDSPISGNVLGNDSDIDDGDVLTVANTGSFATSHGTVTLGADGSFTYTPDANFSGNDHFDYTVQDASGAQSTATASFVVDAVADAPTLTVGNVSGTAGVAIPLGIAATLTDTDGSESLAVTVSGVPTGASLSAGSETAPGVWQLTAADLTDLSITTAPNATAHFTLQVTATSAEISNGSAASTIATIAVDVPDINGTAAADTIFGDNDANVIHGLAGDDVITANGGDDQVFGDDGNDDLHGNGGNDALHGGIGDDRLSGGAGFDQIFGDAGNDTLIINTFDATTDTFDGGAGIDTAAASDVWATGLSIDLSAGLISVAGGGALIVSAMVGVENATGTQFADTITGDAGANVLHGLAGNDSITANGGDDQVFGDDGNDAISGNGGNDVLHGGAGDDRLSGGADFDQIFGDDGNDTLIINTFDGTTDTFDGGTGIDTAEAASGWATGLLIDLSAGRISVAGGGATIVNAMTSVENATGTGFADTITGDAGANVLHGLAGNDSITANGGDDQVFGDDGNDTISGNGGNDILHGGAGDDRLSGGADFDQIFGDDGNDTLIINTFDGTTDTFDGGAGIDTAEAASGWAAGLSIDLNVGRIAVTGGGATIVNAMTAVENATGTSFADVITGNAGANLLRGLGGNDTLNGGLGDDTLGGGTGNDRFVLGAGTGHDVIEDFAAGAGVGDVMDVSAYHLGSFANVLSHASTVSGGTLIQLDAANSVMLLGVSLATLNQDDFLL